LRFQRSSRDLLYLPLECGDALEAEAALEALEMVGASLTTPLKETLPPRLGLRGPLNTLWRRRVGDPWQGGNTDFTALDAALEPLEPGPVLVLGDGGVAETTRQVLARRGWPSLGASRQSPLEPAAVTAFGPVGVIQATRLGMDHGDPAPFPELLAAAEPSAYWAVEWIYKEDTAFAAWGLDGGRRLVGGAALFEAQAEGQSVIFVRECGE
jgi:shikimate 5-dehydrogenase